MKSESKNNYKQWVSIGILIFMLIIEFGQTGLATILFGADDVRIFIFYSTEIYLLTCIAIGVERENLTNLNVDPLFIVLLLSSGIITSAITPYPYNIASGLGLFFILWLFLGSGMVFNPKPALPWVIILTLIALPPIIALLPTIFRLLFFRGSFPNTDALFYFFNETNLTGVVFEEFLFRGLLWKHLRKFGQSEIKVFIVTSILFWLAHYEYLLNGQLFVFWVYVPIVSLLLGLIVYRTKSIGFSSISHFLTNVIVKI